MERIGDDAIVRVIVKMRNRLAEMTREYDAARKVVEDQKHALEVEMLRRLQDRGATQTKTEFGTAFIDEKMQAQIADEAMFQNFVREIGDLDFYQKRIAVKHVKEYMKENGDRLPPGLSIYKELGVVVRVN